ncbi:ATP-binding protein [Streptomyces sp. NPDC056069]|uniref:ATP-binding protein n=1 Tax=Streptomyces sp. NPDC056069 TaxID=3345702 RepID=UPI0035D9863F
MFCLSLGSGPLAPAAARRAVRPALESWGLDEEQVYNMLLVVSELVTNAVTYALPPVVLDLQAAASECGRVRVHVSDGGPREVPDTWAARRPHGEHGRVGI